jgi:uncharacterized membrane protein
MPRSPSGDWFLLDVSGRTGALLGAFANGLSFQPNLISRGSRGQAVISGVAASTAFGWGSAAHSFLRSVATHLPVDHASRRTRLVTGAAVDAVTLGACAAVAHALPAHEDERPIRALARLGATATAAAAAAGLAADGLEIRRGRQWNRVGTLVATLGAWGTGYALARRGTSGSVDKAGEGMREDVVREVDLPQAAAAGVAVTGVLLGMSWIESRLSGLAARAAATTIGGEPEDHRTLGRSLVWATLWGLGWYGLTQVNARLTVAGTGLEPAHADPPVREEVTGGPGSHVSWDVQTRESRRWLSMALTPSAIEAVLGEPAHQPIRVYASLDAAPTAEERAALLLAEIDRTQALRRPVFVLYSPTGSGYINYVATETVEFLTRGNCASAGIQYSVLPSALSLTKVAAGADQTRTVVNGIVERLLSMPADERPDFYLFGESLGCHVSQDIFDGQGISGPAGIGLKSAIWIGTPAASTWREQLWGGRALARPPRVGPGDAYLPRSIGDWVDMPREERERVRFLFLQNGNDPVPKFAPPMLWRRPPWLGPDDERPPGAPRRTWWMPVTTFFTTFVDLQNSLVPTPGVFAEGGHDYRLVIPRAVREVFGFESTEEQMERVEAALRRRELVWETRRRWRAALARPEAERDAALGEVVSKVAAWTGGPADRSAVEDLVAEAV